jgi:signal transduction histidine kinase
MAAPLIAGEHLLGALGVAKSETGGFRTIEEETLQFFAAHAAIALQYVTAVEELRARTRALERANEELRMMQDRLLRQERLATIGQISATVSHELRNPLGTLKNIIDYMDNISRRGEPLPRRSIEMSIRNIKRCNRIIDDLVTHAREVRRAVNAPAHGHLGGGLATRQRFQQSRGVSPGGPLRHPRHVVRPGGVRVRPPAGAAPRLPRFVRKLIPINRPTGLSRLT